MGTLIIKIFGLVKTPLQPQIVTDWYDLCADKFIGSYVKSFYTQIDTRQWSKFEPLGWDLYELLLEISFEK